jgi:hypothetical protein
MGALSNSCVAAGAGLGHGRTAMWLMAVRAGLVTHRCAPMLGEVATRASGLLCSRMRFVALVATAVSGVCHRGGMLRRMAGVTADFEGFWPVRQTAVTALARGVPGVGGDLPNARRVARLASAAVRELQREVMRLVTLRARHLAVQRVIGAGELVARAAGSGRHQCAGAGRVRVVTSDTRNLTALPGMVRVHGLMAVRAGSRGRGGHVVRRVATAALSVCRNPAATKHVLLVTRAAGDGLLLLEPMGLMTTRAFTVPVLEQGSRRHPRRLNRVTRDAGRSRFARLRVQVLMAGRARLRRGLALRDMAGFDVRVATLAGCRLRRRILMGAVAIEARFFAVSFHRGRV